jgi:hypothetical protein
MRQNRTSNLLRKRKKLVEERNASIDTQQPKPITFDERFVKQNAFVNSTARFLDAQCSRRAGKSSGLALRFLRSMESHPGTKCLYMAMTFDSAKEIMWPILQDFDHQFQLGCEFYEGSMTMKHPNGASLRLYGADQKNFIKRLKGQKAVGIAVDEAQDFGNHLQSLIDDVLTPMIADYQDSWIAVTGTPGPVPKGYFFQITQEGKHGFEHHEWAINDNPYMPNPEGFIQDLIKKKEWTLDHPTLMREWRNKWVLDVESLWIRYKEARNHYENLPTHIAKWNYIVGVDLGFRDADALAVLAWSDLSPNLYLVEEIVTTKQGITALSNQIRDVIARYSPYKIVVDAGGLGTKIVEDMRVEQRLPLEAADKKEKQKTVELLNDRLRLGQVLAKKDSRFATDSYLVQIDWEKSSPEKIVVKSNPHSDIIDAVIYAFRHSPFWTYEEPKAEAKFGSKEYEEAMLANHFERLRKQNQNEKDKERDWGTDSNGIPPWNKW